MQAMTKPDDGAAYRTKQNSGFGTWVWVFRRSEQSKQAQEYLIGDWISPFMEATESNTSRRKLEVMSTVTEHSADIGAELSDTITVSGFPADHGQYAGNEEYEFAADRPYATVSVWWSGDPDNPSNDEAYKPSGGEVPTEDDNHRLLATWEIPAMNGTFKIGAGALDAHGAPMYLTAERPGWYVFVWRFEGMTVFPRRPAGMTMPGSVCGCCPMRVGETVRTGETRDAAGAGGGNHAQPSPVTARHGWRCVACLGSGRVSSGDRRHTVHRRSVASSL